MTKDTLLTLISGMIEQQKAGLLSLGSEVIPTLTPEDLLQPNDYEELENDPRFRYEEGILAGLQSAYAALLAAYKEYETSN